MANIDLKNGINSDEDKKQSFGQYYQEELDSMGLESGICLSWSKLTCTITQEEKVNKGFLKKKTIQKPYHLLNNVSGYVKPGMLTLLLGPPSSGKTTLLECLSGRKNDSSHRVSGDVLINGRAWTQDFNRISGYVSQDDYHIPLLTVRETLSFSSRLRNHPTLSEQKKAERVEVVMDILGIKHVANTVVGGELLRGVSGGERKRVSIGVELVNCPSILFLDEPTSGLDSAAAYDIVRTLRDIADTGVPVICSLLQPSQDLYNLFDHIIVMSNRECVYFGPTDGAIEHFDNAGYQYPEYKNTAEYLLDLCTPDEINYRKANSDPQPLADFYQASKEYEELGKTLWYGVVPPRPHKTIMPSNRIFHSDMAYQLLICTERSIKMFLRNKRAIFARALRSIIVGLLIGTLFWQMGLDQLGGTNRISLMFFCITFTAMGAVASLPQVVEERRIFYHQRASHFFRTISYFLSSLVMDIPLSFLEGIIFTTLVFWMTGLYNSQYNYLEIIIQYIVFVLVLLVSNITSKQFCRFCAASTPNLGFASSVGSSVLCIWLVFAGFLIPRSSIPMYWLPLNLLSPFRYTLESLSLNALTDITLTCDPAEYVPPSPIPLKYCDPFDTSVCYSTCPITSGTQLLNQYGLNTDSQFIFIDLIVLIIFYIAMCICTYLALEYVHWNILHSSAISSISVFQSNQSNKWRKRSEKIEISENVEHLQGSSLAFNQLYYSVNLNSGLIGKLKKKNFKTLLTNISGYVPAGRMIALMGATGAGKTTLLDVLAQRKTGGNLKGDIIVNGKLKDRYYNRLVGYVEQTNVFLPTLTVKETLEYSALMRLPIDLPAKERIQRVDDVLDQLSLIHVANSYVGTPESGGLSMELRKKLSIAVELVAEPAIFFLDEPTTGLDSQAAASVMETARIVSNTGVPVICTIHQPSADLFYLFDWLLLLRPGGHTVYFGPLGERGSEVLDYFKNFGIDCPVNKNPAEFVLECSGAGFSRSQSTVNVSTPSFNIEEEEEEIESLEISPQSSNITVIPKSFNSDKAWNDSEEAKELSKIVEEAHQSAIANSSEKSQFNSSYAVPIHTQLFLSIKRSLKNKYRQTTVVRSYIGMYLIMALILGSLYWQLGYDQAGARNRVALIYFCIVFAALGAIATIPGVILQRAVYYREKPSFLRPFAYFVSQIIAEIPLISFSVGLFAILVYLMTGLNLSDDGGRLLFFVGVYSLSAFTSTAYAMMVASSVATTEVANTIVGISSSIFSLFAGFIIPKGSIPKIWIWMHYLSFYKYPLEALSINELEGEVFNCTPSQEVPIKILSTGAIQFYCPVQSGTTFLSQHFTMNTTYEAAYEDITVLSIFLCVFILFTYIGIRWINHLKR